MRCCRRPISIPVSILQCSSFSTRAPRDKYNFNGETSFNDAPDPNVLHYPRVTANDLAKNREPPTCVKVITRDFIEDSLYNPHYGYFSKQATIFSASNSEQGFDFNSIKNARQFDKLVADRYTDLADKSEHSFGPGAQVWHTPSELFKPYYGQSIARCLVAEYLLKYFPYEDFNIYEIGAGNGTLALDVLDFLAQEHPEVYERTRYSIIEISESMAQLQKAKLETKHPCVNIVNKSVFRWDRPVEHAPCFFIALEVVDNFAHDAIRYDLETMKAYQTLVVVDASNDFSTLFEPVWDPLIMSYLDLRRVCGHHAPLPRFLRSDSLRSLYRALPFAPNLSKPEYVPTRLLSLMRVLKHQFPRHKLLLSDFSSLPNTIEGYNSPVVQTRLQGHMVPVSTYMVKQGCFDIFFPTDFELLRDMYEIIMSQPTGDVVHQEEQVAADYLPRSSPLAPTVSSLELGARFFFSKGRRMPMDGVASGSGLPIGQRKSNVFTHREFAETYGQLEKTQLQNGENPMLEFYQNVKILF